MYSARAVVINNVTVLPKTAAKVAAALMILGVGPTYFPAHDITRPTQAKVFSQPEVFDKAQKGSLTVVLTSYSTYVPGTDVTRLKPQAKTFSEAETFAQARRGIPLILNTAAYVPATDVTRLKPQAKTFSESETFPQAQRSTQVVINGRPVTPTGADIFIGSDTFGWGSFDPQIFAQAQRGSLIVLTPPVPVIGSDVFIGQDVTGWVFTPETFLQAQRGSLPVVLNIPYNYQTDVTKLRPQAKYFSEPEVFAQQMPKQVIRLIPYVPYSPTTDVRRRPMAYAWSEPETFQRPAPFNQLVVNGSGQPPPTQTIRVRAVYDGEYGGQFYEAGDVFDILITAFSNNAVNYGPNSATIQLGWMVQVPTGTTLYQARTSGLTSIGTWLPPNDGGRRTVF